jgi:glyoxylase-like metal-dependent hydrolase (beta-lactamase superfamily II)
MIIKVFPFGIYDENIYVFIDEKSREAAIVDPGGQGARLIDEIEGLNCKIKYILLTHGHFDHVSALKEVKNKYDVPVYMHKAEAELMLKDNTVFGEIPDEYETIEDGDVLSFGNTEIKCIHTPGHTKGGICFLIEDSIFTGDTLFQGSVGRSDFIGGDFNQLISGIKEKLMILDGNIKVYPGHGPSSTIAYEKMRNSFLQDEFDIF